MNPRNQQSARRIHAAGTETHPKTPTVLWATTLALLLISSLASAQTKRTSDGDGGGGTGTQLMVSDASIKEGSAGAPSILRFKVDVSQSTREPGSALPVTFSYRVVDRGACCMHGDYQAITGRVTIPAHTASTEIPVIVYGDDVREKDETLELIVDGATNASIADGVAMGTIVNDDIVDDAGGGSGGPKRQPNQPETQVEGPGKIEPGDGASPGLPPYVFLSDNVVMEGKEGASTLLFKVRLSQASLDPVMLTYELKDLTALSRHGDYQSGSATVTIPANRTTGLIAVTVFGDEAKEADETFMVVANHAVNARFLGEAKTATGTITNDDWGVPGGGTGGPRRDDPDSQRDLMQPTIASFNLASSNPVRGLPSFRFAIGRASHVTLAIYDMQGRLVGTPVEADFAAGTHLHKWNQSPPAPGIYLARFQTEDQTVTQRISWLQ